MKNTGSLKVACAVFLSGIASLSLTIPACAGFILRIDDNEHNSIEIDRSGAYTSAGTVVINTVSGSPDGQIEFDGSFGSGIIMSFVAKSKPLLENGPGLAAMELSTLVEAPAGRMLTVKLTDTDFPYTSLGEDVARWLSLTGSGLVTTDVYFDPANTSFGTGGLHFPLGTLGASVDPQFVELEMPWPYPKDAPYSITTIQVIEGSGLGALTYNKTGITQTPEPGGGLMALICCVPVGFVVWHKRRQAARVG